MKSPKLQLRQPFAFLDVGGGGVSSKALSASLNRAGLSVSFSVVLDDVFFLGFFCTNSLSAPAGQLFVLFYQPVNLSCKPVPSNTFAVGQSLPGHLLNRCFHSLPVRDVPIVPTELKLGCVAVQMLFADVMERANDPTLNQAEKAFRGVYMGNAAVRILAGILFGRVIHNVVTRKLPVYATVNAGLVRVDNRLGRAFLEALAKVYAVSRQK